MLGPMAKVPPYDAATRRTAFIEELRRRLNHLEQVPLPSTLNALDAAFLLLGCVVVPLTLLGLSL